MGYCEMCGAPLPVNHFRFCSETCYREFRAKPIVYTCEKCGRTFKGKGYGQKICDTCRKNRNGNWQSKDFERMAAQRRRYEKQYGECGKRIEAYCAEDAQRRKEGNHISYGKMMAMKYREAEKKDAD